MSRCKIATGFIMLASTVALLHVHRTPVAVAVEFMAAHPQRAYFALLLRGDGPMSRGRTGISMEVGVADGRFSEHMLLHARPRKWLMVEPFVNAELRGRLATNGSLSWQARGIGVGTTSLQLLQGLSLDKSVLDAIPDSSCDFVYLDGAHDYANVKLEMTPYWRKVRWLRDRTSVASTPQDTTRKPRIRVSPACSLC